MDKLASILAVQTTTADTNCHLSVFWLQSAPWPLNSHPCRRPGTDTSQAFTCFHFVHHDPAFDPDIHDVSFVQQLTVRMSPLSSSHRYQSSRRLFWSLAWKCRSRRFELLAARLNAHLSHFFTFSSDYTSKVECTISLCFTSDFYVIHQNVWDRSEDVMVSRCLGNVGNSRARVLFPKL